MGGRSRMGKKEIQHMSPTFMHAVTVVFMYVEIAI